MAAANRQRGVIRGGLRPTLTPAKGAEPLWNPRSSTGGTSATPARPPDPLDAGGYTQAIAPSRSRAAISSRPIPSISPNT